MGLSPVQGVCYYSFFSVKVISYRSLIKYAIFLFTNQKIVPILATRRYLEHLSCRLLLKLAAFDTRKYF